MIELIDFKQFVADRSELCQQTYKKLESGSPSAIQFLEAIGKGYLKKISKRAECSESEVWKFLDLVTVLGLCEIESEAEKKKWYWSVLNTGRAFWLKGLGLVLGVSFEGMSLDDQGEVGEAMVLRGLYLIHPDNQS